ncbi:Bud site selection protein [Yarrowia sp. C11]|nr:Bud site selection protein [Yarrowia sp. E02]KAG5373025.1 Bud site selection protein [Yarrowia sp. C11]
MNDLSDILSKPSNPIEDTDGLSDSGESSFTFDSSYSKRTRPFSAICVSKSVTSALTTCDVPAPEKAEILSETPEVPRRSMLRPKSEILDAAEANSLVSKFSQFSENRHFGGNKQGVTGSALEKRLLAQEAHMLETHGSLESSRDPSPNANARPRDMAEEIASLSISNGTCKVLPKVSSSASLASRDPSVNPFSDLTKRVYHLKPAERTLDPNSPTRDAFFDNEEEVEEGETMDGVAAHSPDTPQTSGSDFEGSIKDEVVEEAAEEVDANTASPVSPVSPVSSVSSEALDTVDKNTFADDSMIGNDSLLTLELDSNPLDFSGFGLSRKNTITSSGGSLSSCRPSESSGAFRKLRNARTKFGSMKKSDIEKQKQLAEQKEKEWKEQEEKRQEQRRMALNSRPVSVFESDSSIAGSPSLDGASDAASVMSSNSEATTTSFHSAATYSSNNNTRSTHTLDPNARAAVLSPPSPPSPIEETFDMHIMQQLTQMPTPEFNRMMESPKFSGHGNAAVEQPRAAPVAQVAVVAPVAPVCETRPISQDSATTAVSLHSAAASTHSAAASTHSAAASTTSTAVSGVSSSAKGANGAQATAAATAPVVPAIDRHDRGRLFMAIRGIKDIRLPIDHTRHPKFSLTLDNGIQCVTTEPMDLRSSAKIEQEFELIVGDDLELVFTLKSSMDPLVRSMLEVDEEVEEEVAPRDESKDRKSRDKAEKSKPLKSALKSRDASPEKKQELSSPSRDQQKESAPSTPTKKLSKGRSFKALFSPRKRKQQPAVEAVKEESEEDSSEPTKKQVTHAPEPKKRDAKATQVSKAGPKHIRHPDLWDHIVSSSGSFARCYIVESQYESEIFGRSRTYSVPLYNEWGQEKVESQDSRGRKTHTWKRQEPYRIGCLEITLMYIPRVSRYDRLPSSMQACRDELAAAKKCQEMHMEGFLSQEGGDCAYWRRRWFRLDGHVLRGFHEDTMKERCVFDLSHVTDIVELGNPKSRSSKSSHVHSGLVGGYVLVEGAFRVTFADNTFVNFYAENDAEKAKWVSILSVAMQHVPGKNATWTDLVFQQHKKEAETSAKIAQGWNVERSGFSEGGGL